jgi:hypothetical protein
MYIVSVAEQAPIRRYISVRTFYIRFRQSNIRPSPIQTITIHLPLPTTYYLHNRRPSSTGLCRWYSDTPEPPARACCIVVPCIVETTNSQILFKRWVAISIRLRLNLRQPPWCASDCSWAISVFRDSDGQIMSRHDAVWGKPDIDRKIECRKWKPLDLCVPALHEIDAHHGVV